MGRDVDHTDGGIARFREARANGTNQATLHAPAVLAGDYDVELLDALPAAIEFLRIDAAGKLSTIVSSGGDLDDAYDFGGAGAGRSITADAGAVEIITSTDTAALFINKTGVGVGTPVQISDAGTGTSLSVSKTGASGLTALMSNADGSLSWGNQLSVQSSAASVTAIFSHLGVGAEAVLQLQSNGTGPALHVDQSSAGTDAAIIRIEADALLDASIELVEAATQRFELGYDQSAAAFVIGLLSFADPIMSILDTSGFVRFQGNAVNGDFVRVDKPGGANGDAVVITSASTTGRALFVEGTAGAEVALFQATHAAFSLHCVGTADTPLAFFEKKGVGVGDAVEIDNAGTGIGLLLDQDGNGRALVIDSEATSNPLIDLDSAPASANTRGDIKFSQARAADPSSPATGDMWYNSTSNTMKYFDGTVNVSF